MKFAELKQFISEDMSMSHIYQPVMLIELLNNNGRATVKQIAQSILNHDPTQIDIRIINVFIVAEQIAFRIFFTDLGNQIAISRWWRCPLKGGGKISPYHMLPVIRNRGI
jgi:hypothetical protein